MQVEGCSVNVQQSPSSTASTSTSKSPRVDCEKLAGKMQEVAHYILRKTPTEEDILRTRTIFAVCNEAKRQESWQVMYDFAMRLDLERLLNEQNQLNDQQRTIAYQEWLSKVVESLYGLKRYDECMDFARKGFESYPQNQLFYEWYERAHKALEQVPVTVEQKREADNVMSDIPLIHFADIHFGDLFHRSAPYPRAVGFAAKMIHTLTNNDIPVLLSMGIMRRPVSCIREAWLALGEVILQENMQATNQCFKVKDKYVRLLRSVP